MTKRFHRLFADNAGATAIEYGLFAALIGVVIISALAVLGPGIEMKFMDMDTAIRSTNP